MANTLDENLSYVANAPFELEIMGGDIAFISKLDDEPNDVGGMSSAELKAEFDKAGLAIQRYLNEYLVPKIVEEEATNEVRAASEAERVANEAARVANEEARISAEAERVSSEAQRVENEIRRENAETGYVAQAESAAESATRDAAIASTAATQATKSEAAAKAAQTAAEKAAADAQSAVGGDFVTHTELEEAIEAIPKPDVSAEIEAHNTSPDAHSDIRTAVRDAVNAANAAKNVSASTASALGLPNGASVDDALRKMETNVQVEETLVKIKQAGAFWETCGTVPSNDGNYEDALLLSCGDSVYAFTRNSTGNSPRVSYDNGKTWLMAGNSPHGLQGASGAATNGEVGYVTAGGQSGMCYRLTLDGQDITYDSVYTYLPETVTWWHAAYGNGAWVIFPYSGNYAAYAVEAGRDTTFSKITLPINGTLWTCVRFVGDKFIALSTSGCIYSYDGETWYSCTGSSFTNPYSVAYKNGVYVIGTADSDFGVSDDGIAWRKAATATESGQGRYVAATDEVFVAISNGNGKTYYSFDGDTWECNTNAVLSSGNWLPGPESFISHNGVLLAAVPYGTGATCMTTYDEYNYQYELMYPNGELNTEKVMSALGLPGTKIETGSYKGTGTYGSGNPNSLTFPFEPKVVFIQYYRYFAVFFRGSDNAIVFGASGINYNSTNAYAWTMAPSWNGNTLSWYTHDGSNGPSAQLNNSSYTYYYYAIG